jgi:competence protein ComEA
MQHQNRISSFFSFTKSEMRGLIVLLILMIVLLGARFILNRTHEIFQLTYSETGSLPEEENDTLMSNFTNHLQGENQRHFNRYKSRRKVDPNSTGYIGLIKSGIPVNAAKNIIAYRNRGGKFFSNTDLLKIEGIDSFLIQQLEGLLLYNTRTFERKENTYKPGTFSNKLIELNNADTAELKKLTGIGPVLAARIVKYRDALGGFYSPHQLSEVYGISDSLVQILSPFLVADTLSIRKISLNSISLEELQRHPYLSRFQAKAILSYRRLAGPFNRVEELLQNYLISDENYWKIRPYLDVN